MEGYCSRNSGNKEITSDEQFQVCPINAIIISPLRNPGFDQFASFFHVHTYIALCCIIILDIFYLHNLSLLYHGTQVTHYAGNVIYNVKDFTEKNAVN